MHAGSTAHYHAQSLALCRGTALHSAAVRQDLERESTVSCLVCPLSGDLEAVERRFPLAPPFPALRAWRIWESGGRPEELVLQYPAPSDY